ncbi:MAG: thioredoxin domain-containing protein [Candidatus Pacebacteria bacterium]|nr:thioredoxin domain-containing protein [Candidatus Paceibacterota bacterium]
MENNKKQSISVPAAIIVAGLLIMMGILLTNNKNNSQTEEPKTLSEQIDVSKDELLTCLESKDYEVLGNEIIASVDSAMKAIPENERGTPYAVVLKNNSPVTDLRGAYPYESVKTLVDELVNEEIEANYEGEVPLPNEKDHVYGNPNAPITVIEYSDYECPYCKNFHETMKKVVDESNGQVNWIYRHFPIKQNSFEKSAAAECVAEIKGNDAFWQYSDLLFGLLEPAQKSVSEQL